MEQDTSNDSQYGDTGMNAHITLGAECVPEAIKGVAKARDEFPPLAFPLVAW